MARPNSRLNDPTRFVGSTHRASPVRTYVYEQLGISKPGFWADWRKRTLLAPKVAAHDEQETPEVAEDPTQNYELAKWEPETPTSWKTYKLPITMQETAQTAGKGSGPHSSLSIFALMAKQSQSWFKTNKLLTNLNAMSVGDAQLAVQEKEITDIFGGVGGSGGKYSNVKSISQYYAVKAQERANARAKKPFGELEPTNFDKMLALFEKPKPIYTPPTYKVLTQGTSTLAKPNPTTTIGALNVSQNGYVSTYRPPQKQATSLIGSKIKAANPTLKVGGTLKGAGKVPV